MMRTFLRSLAVAGLLLVTVSVAQTGGSVLTWTAPTQYTDGTTIPSTDTLTYNVYEGVSTGSEVLIASGVTALTYTTATVKGCWKVSAVAAGGEGPTSVEVCKRVPKAPGLSVK
jgi:hypothetical protein